MAGDWIKMRVDLATDPAVIGIAASLDCTEFEVVGMLHHFWSWVDAQSRDGHAASVTKSWIDRYVQRVGFANQLEKVGWLVAENDGISIPNFERHNGQSAKKRAVDGKRQKTHRENLSREPSRNERDKSVTREEKRREEKELVPKGTCDQQADLLGGEAKKNVVVIPYEKILDAFREKLPGFPQPRRPLDEDRRKAIRLIWTRDDRFGSVDFFSRFFGFVSQSEFLTGWKGCGFDWLLKPKNFRKVLEGNYNGGNGDA